MRHRIACLVPLLTLALTVAADEIDDWLADHAMPVRSIDISDDDFADLEPLVAAIGDARIVQLGESSHGAGATFSAKARLIRFLHERMGFDVVAWESGMYDVHKVEEALRAGVDPAEAGQHGIFTLWSGTEEVLPLLRYAQRTQESDSPLTMAGFDMQFSGGQGSYREDLTELFGGLPEGDARDRALRLVTRFLDGFSGFQARRTARFARMRELREQGLADQELQEALDAWEHSEEAPAPPGPEALAAFKATGAELLELFDSVRDRLEMARDAREIGFMRRTIGNVLLFGTTMYERNAPHLAQEEGVATVNNRGWNRRDARNADNLLWLADEYFAGRKIIVWAHNGHVMNAYYAPDWRSLSHDPIEDGMKPTGVFLKEVLGDDVYTIGFTAFEGSQRQQGGSDVLPVETAPQGSLEARLAALAEPHLFLDLRPLRANDGHPLRSPFTMAIRGYMPESMEDWTRVIDGVFFNRTMTPSTPIARRPGPQ